MEACWFNFSYFKQLKITFNTYTFNFIIISYLYFKFCNNLVSIIEINKPIKELET